MKLVILPERLQRMVQVLKGGLSVQRRMLHRRKIEKRERIVTYVFYHNINHKHVSSNLLGSESDGKKVDCNNRDNCTVYIQEESTPLSKSSPSPKRI
jgi:hypothetical protein